MVMLQCLCTMIFSRAEVATLLILLAASAGLFWRRFAPVVKKIHEAKPDADFQLAPAGKRIRDFIWEVLLQAKVIRERPWPGLAHAFVFWGFCAFALVTVNHLATGFGAPFLSCSGAFGRGYFDVAAMFAVCVAVSITGLFIRRFVAQPKWLGELSPESAVIAILIFVLMFTYYGRVRERRSGDSLQAVGSL